MKLPFRGGLVIALAMAVAAGFGRASYTRFQYDKQALAQLTDKMRTVCVGRFLIDLPAQVQVELGQTRIDGFDVSAFDERLEEFQKRAADREAQLRDMPDRPGGGKNLESAIDVKTDNGLIGKIFTHSRTVSEGTQRKGQAVERYRDEGITSEALVHGSGVSVDLSSENRDIKWIDGLPKLVKQLVTNPDSRIPAQAGFCTARAYFLDPLTADQNEQITMLARLPSHPDVRFMLILSAGLKPDGQGLLDRSSTSSALLSILERIWISKLRAAPRELAGLPGEELVRTYVEKNDARVYSFWWEVNGTEDNVLVPHFLFKMDTGKGDHGPVPSSLSEGVAVGLWDKILSSIRLRPVDQAKPQSFVSVSAVLK